MDGFQGAREPDLALGEVYGLRWWNLTMDRARPVLRGANAMFWNAGENVAECQCRSGFASYVITGSDAGWGRALKHEAPCECDDCACGFWAYWTPQLAARPPVTGWHTPVLGVIKGWGLTTIGPKGFRCQKAQIVAVVCNWHTSRMDQGDAEYVLEQAYGVEAYTTAAMMLMKHPLTEGYCDDTEQIREQIMATFGLLMQQQAALQLPAKDLLAALTAIYDGLAGKPAGRNGPPAGGPSHP